MKSAFYEEISWVCNSVALLLVHAPGREKEGVENLTWVLCKNERNVIFFPLNATTFRNITWLDQLFTSQRETALFHKGAALAFCITNGTSGHFHTNTLLYNIHRLFPRHTLIIVDTLLLFSQTISHTHYPLTKGPLTTMLFHCLFTDDAFQTECKLYWYIFLAG